MAYTENSDQRVFEKIIGEQYSSSDVTQDLRDCLDDSLDLPSFGKDFDSLSQFSGFDSDKFSSAYSSKLEDENNG